MNIPALGRADGTIALLIAAVAFAIVLVTRRFWLWLLGPVFAYESARLARQGRVIVLRGIYVVGLLALLYAIVPATLEVAEEALDHVAFEFSRAFLLAQAAVVMLVTPLYVAGAIGDEKEKRSLDFLLCTPLSSREIVLGKLAARLLNLFGLLLAR